MEFSQPVSQHYATEGWKERKRWGIEGDPSYSTEGWKQVPKAWYDGGGHGTGSASDEWSLSPSHGNVDKVLYQNLLEMIPLLDSFMNQQWSQNKTFSRHASLVYTPTPSLKKAAENPRKGKRVRQLFRNKPGEAQDCFLWDENDDLLSYATQDTHAQGIAAVAFPSDQAAENFVSKAEMLQLQSQIEQLEQKLEEKDNQLQSAETSIKQDLLQLQTKVWELQRELWDKDQKIEDTCTELSGKQGKILCLRSLLERAEAGVLESDRKAAGIEGELKSLRCQVAALLLQLENTQFSAAYDHTWAVDAPENSSACSMPVKGQMSEEEEQAAAAAGAVSHDYKVEVQYMESIRRKYLAAVIVARESPSEELLLLVAEFRSQLQALLMQPPFSSVPSDILCSCLASV